MNTPERGCGVCQARRVRCDRTIPSCARCLKAGRTCDGFGLRLSWPHSSDRKRAVFTVPPRNESSFNKSDDISFVQTTSWDMRIHYRLSAEGWNRTVGKYLSGSPVLTTPVRWIPHQLDASQEALVQYFESHASFSLTTVGIDALKLRSTLLRLAFMSSAPASAAVLQSLLAVASLHCYGHQPRAAHYKLSAIQLLNESSKRGLETKEIIQHGAAGMLLASFEIQNPTETSSHWPWYVCGCKGIFYRACDDRLAWYDSDFLLLLGWIQYHEVVARFSFRHWRGHGAFERDYVADEGFTGLLPGICGTGLAKIPYPSGPSNEILSLLSEVYDNVVEPSDSRYNTDEYRNYLEVLEWRIKRATGPSHATQMTHSAPRPDAPIVAKLYQLATLVYLERTSTKLSGQSEKVTQIVDSAFSIFRELETCQWPFPLLIFACEARGDGERMVILDLIAKTERKAHVRSLESLKTMVRFVWTQDDLAEGPIDYADKMSTLMSISDSVPSFV
ncbi:hypothetical protein P152DRAFT_504320 [Eremomyces bilateralis CBS 781.70]|uniref:Zn(2)-C6 fungal-type domain-containing protein n=1 Tax=Eremomyces bilateralis CBS 781.70 TaxID=1392243 RepID=A0A6G1GFG6_9PEZI|nr:uncharacterized protein P152DRAFT_504320 [Eremomyces bilateralis CBS 781.70]KAF1816827.1 hypothetical protein P152DRAFT_504320 [Eremomyces bilateralis CBS 781.70]